MRVLLDTNLHISFLLTRGGPETSIRRLIGSAINGKYDLVVPHEVVGEIRERAANKRYLRQRIDQEAVERYVDLLWTIGEVLPPLTGVSPRVTRDRKDDFLLTAAVAGDVDILVSGDHDLQAIRSLLARPSIMTAAEFLKLIDPPEVS